MRQAHDAGGQSPLDPVLLDELRWLLAQLCDGQLPQSDWHRLNQILGEHAEARRYYLRYIGVHSALATTAGCTLGSFVVDAQLAVERLTLERFTGRTTPLSLCAPQTPASARGLRWRSVIRWAASLSAVLLVAAASFWWVRRADYVGSQQPALRAEHSVEVAGNQPLVAEVTYVSASATWRNANGSFTLASRVQTGQSLARARSGRIDVCVGRQIVADRAFGVLSSTYRGQLASRRIGCSRAASRTWFHDRDSARKSD